MSSDALSYQIDFSTLARLACILFVLPMVEYISTYLQYRALPNFYFQHLLCFLYIEFAQAVTLKGKLRKICLAVLLKIEAAPHSQKC